MALKAKVDIKKLRQTNPQQALKIITRRAMNEWELCFLRGDKYITCSHGFTDESKLRDAIKDKIGGQSEVSVSTGRVDLLTDEELIEVKNVKQWKDGVGQLLIYGSDFPDKDLRLHLFGKVEINLLKTIIQKCADFDIYISWRLDWFSKKRQKELWELTELRREFLSEIDDCWDYPGSPYRDDFWENDD